MPRGSAEMELELLMSDKVATNIHSEESVSTNQSDSLHGGAIRVFGPRREQPSATKVVQSWESFQPKVSFSYLIASRKAARIKNS